MLPIALSLLAAALAPAPRAPQAICDIGRAALRDLPPIDRNAGEDVYYGGADPRHRGLLDVCPDLRNALPDGYRMADADAEKRASVHIPVPGNPPKWAGIYIVGVPELAADGKSAKVGFTFECTGLCGAGFESRYILTATGWQRDGKPHTLWVS